MNDVPVTVSVKSAEPTTADVGLIDPIVGVGFETGGGVVDEYPAPPQPDNNFAASIAGTRTRAGLRLAAIRRLTRYFDELLSLADWSDI